MQKADGVILFPETLPFERTALGIEYPGSVNGMAMSLTLPRVLDNRDGPWAGPPTVEAEGIDYMAEHWGIGVWNTDLNRTVRVNVRTAYFRGTLPGPDSSGHNANVSDAYKLDFDPWFSRVISWLSVWSGIDLRSNLIPEPGVDAHLRFRTNGGSGFSPGGYAFINRRGITEPEFRGAVARASDGEVPPLPWRIYLDALRSNDNRRAVIDAGAARTPTDAARVNVGRWPYVLSQAGRVVCAASGTVDKRVDDGLRDGALVTLCRVHRNVDVRCPASSGRTAAGWGHFRSAAAPAG